jgi:hypothetical protein
MVCNLPPPLAVNICKEKYDSVIKKQPHYKILSGLAILLLICALLTILPYPAASKPNLLGYKSLCAFAPLSTLILLGAAGFVRIFRDTHKGREKKG